MTSPPSPNPFLSEAVLQYLQIPQFKGSVLEAPPSLMTYGPSGSGKSTETGILASRCLWIVTKPTVMRPYAHWCKKFPEIAKELGVHIPEAGRPFEQGGVTVVHLPEAYPNGAPIDTLGTLLNMFNGFRQAAAAGSFPWAGVFFDEWSVVMNRIWAQCQRHDIYPWAKAFLDKKNLFNPWGEVGGFIISQIRNLTSFTNDAYKMFGANAHESPPRYWDKLDIKRGATVGDVKETGGPAHPNFKIMTDVIYDFDIVLRLTLEEKQVQAAGMLSFGAAAAPATPTVTTGFGPTLLSGAPAPNSDAAGMIQMITTPTAVPKDVPLSQQPPVVSMSFGAPSAPFGSVPMPAPLAMAVAAMAPPAPPAAPRADDEATAAVGTGSEVVIKGGYIDTVEAFSSSGLIRRYQLERSADYEAKIRAFVVKTKRKLGLRGLLEEAAYNVNVL